MIRNLDAIKEQRYRTFIASRQRQIQSHNQDQKSNSVLSQRGIHSRGQPLMTTGRRTFSMFSVSSFKSSGSGCGCGS